MKIIRGKLFDKTFSEYFEISDTQIQIKFMLKQQFFLWKYPQTFWVEPPPPPPPTHRQKQIYDLYYRMMTIYFYNKHCYRLYLLTWHKISLFFSISKNIKKGGGELIKSTSYNIIHNVIENVLFINNFIKYINPLKKGQSHLLSTACTKRINSLRDLLLTSDVRKQ